MEEKITKRQEQAKNTRDRIYRTAVELIEKKGLNNITVEEICKQAQVSVGSFYNCFKSKNEILNEIYKVADDYFDVKVAKHVNVGSTRDRIINFFHYYADYNVNRGVEFVKQLYNAQNTLFITKGRPMQAVLYKIIEEGQKLGDIKSKQTPDEIVRYFFIAARGVVYDWCLYDGEYDLVSFMDSYIANLIKILD